jgi:hypothetical protein
LRTENDRLEVPAREKSEVSFWEIAPKTTDRMSRHKSIPFKAISDPTLRHFQYALFYFFDKGNWIITKICYLIKENVI